MTELTPPLVAPWPIVMCQGASGARRPLLGPLPPVRTGSSRVFTSIFSDVTHGSLNTQVCSGKSGSTQGGPLDGCATHVSRTGLQRPGQRDPPPPHPHPHSDPLQHPDRWPPSHGHLRPAQGQELLKGSGTWEIPGKAVKELGGTAVCLTPRSQSPAGPAPTYRPVQDWVRVPGDSTDPVPSPVFSLSKTESLCSKSTSRRVRPESKGRRIQPRS